MLFYILPITFFVMLGVVWFNEGGKRALKIFGYFSATILLFIIAILLIIRTRLITNKTEVIGISLFFRYLIWGGYAIWLIIYNFKNGYIGKF